MPMLNVSGLVKRFGALRAVNEISFEVAEGEILGLIGPNGSGKSTIFNCIAGLYAPEGGSIAFEGADITGLPPNRICHKGIGRTFQIPRPFRNLTLLENVALSAFFGLPLAAMMPVFGYITLGGLDQRHDGEVLDYSQHQPRQRTREQDGNGQVSERSRSGHQ